MFHCKKLQLQKFIIEYMLFSLCVKSFSCARVFETPWTIAYQAPLSIRFPRQEYWNELPFLSPGDLPNPGIEPESPALADGFFTTEPPEKSYLSVGSSETIDPWHWDSRPLFFPAKPLSFFQLLGAPWMLCFVPDTLHVPLDYLSPFNQAGPMTVPGLQTRKLILREVSCSKSETKWTQTPTSSSLPFDFTSMLLTTEILCLLNRPPLLDFFF